MMYSIFCVLPFVVCLLWTILFALRWHEHSDAQRMLLFFAGVCTVLYGCHAHYLTETHSIYVESLWMMCSLAVYPLFYLYIVLLTDYRRRPTALNLLLLLPALLLPAAHLLFPNYPIRTIQSVVFVLLIVYVCTMGLVRLYRLERDIQNTYSNTTDKSSRGIQWLLTCFALTSLFSIIFSAIGRDTFREDLLVAVPSLLFSTMLFILFYVGDRYSFSARQMQREECQPLGSEEELPTPVSDEEQAQFVARLQHLMEEEQVFLEPNLKLNDLALRVGTCRTYLSNYLNQTLKVSFSDYINEQRIRYAQRLKERETDATISYLSVKSGFNSEQSFVRNYRKFTGQSPQ